MKNYKYIHTVLGAALIFSLAACPGDTNDDTGSSTGDTPNTDPSMGTGTTVVDPTVDPTTTMVNPTTTMDPDTSTSSSTTVDPDTTMGPDPTVTTGDPPGGFVFPDDPYDAYEQIDRHGAVEAGTAGIGAKEGLGFSPGQDTSLRDPYNKSNPEEDAAGMWVPDIADSVTFFHDALDDDIMGFGLTPASFDDSIAQAGPVIIPDTIKYDATMPTGYPNGRALTDPVVDITLAAVLLKLGPNQPLTTFADLPLNPPENDVPFLGEFPYLAPPHPAP
jgi:hypothetical protein